MYTHRGVYMITVAAMVRVVGLGFRLRIFKVHVLH